MIEVDQQAMNPQVRAAVLATLAGVRDYARSIRSSHGGGGQQVMDDLRRWLDERVYEVATAP